MVRKPTGSSRSGGWVAEKAGRLKLNGRVLSYSLLSRLVELEGLIMGITGKTTRVARAPTLAERDSWLDAGQLDRLLERAERQLAELYPHHERAALEALAA